MWFNATWPAQLTKGVYSYVQITNANFFMMRTIYLLIHLTLLFLIPVALKAQKHKFITVQGTEIIGADQKPFLIKGTNLGNWLVPEGYMFKFKSINSPGLINEALLELIGPGDAKIFWQQYQDNYVTEGDIHFLKTIGVNSIRIPFNYRMFTPESYMAQSNQERGFELLDRVIKWCKRKVCMLFWICIAHRVAKPATILMMVTATRFCLKARQCRKLHLIFGPG